jgi:hypothetical protein
MLCLDGAGDSGIAAGALFLAVLGRPRGTGEFDDLIRAPSG